MADISKIKTIDGTTYNIKDPVARRDPIETKMYTQVIGTANDSQHAAFFYMKLRALDYNNKWHVVVRVHAYCPGSASMTYMFDTVSEFEVWGYGSTYCGYKVMNYITNRDYLPFYYHSLFLVSATGYDNNCGNWLGFNLASSKNPANTNYKRTFVVDLIEYDGCEVEMSDTLYTPDTIPNRADHTNWYSNTNTSFNNFNANAHGDMHTGDQNTTTVSALIRGAGGYAANSIVYRFQLLFDMGDGVLTPLNNVSNGYNNLAKTMLTNVEFDPFRPIYFYNTTTTVQPGASIGAGSLYWHYNDADPRYSLNCGNTLTANKPLYLVVTPTSNGKCKIANTTPWSQTLPTVADGNWYILLGQAHNSYKFCLFETHPIFEHNGTGIVHVLPNVDNNLLNLVYPVGSIYLSVASTNPGTLFGGTWVRIQDTFLLAAGSSYAAGTTGGEATHTLTTSEMPTHAHYPTGSTESERGNWRAALVKDISGRSGKLNMADGTGRYSVASTTSYDDIGMASQTGYTGDGAAHNNMPPYLAVYVWKRTA